MSVIQLLSHRARQGLAQCNRGPLNITAQVAIIPVVLLSH
jgi:hypothetical protein